MTSKLRGRVWLRATMIALAMSSGCKGGGDGDGGGDGGTRDDDSPSSQDDSSPHAACVVSTQRAELPAHGVDEVDLLFVVGDTASMAEEQAALRAEFPHIVSALTSGDLTPGDGSNDADFAAVKSVHLGVVSSDLGAPGITGLPGCVDLGDDGLLNNVPGDLVGCSPSGYPQFLTHTAGTNDPLATANDLGCIAALGLEGCQFAQPLESAIKALWPSDDTRITFVPNPQGFGGIGHGDAIMGGSPGSNAGFLRSDPDEGPSLVVVVVVTDAEDCSSKNLSHFRPASSLNPAEVMDQQLMQQSLGTRCFFNPQNLYTKERYINGLKALRPENEALVVFAAIVGVPVETVAELPDDLASNDAARAAFYAGLRAHPSMQPMVDTLGTSNPDDDVMRASCDTSSTGKAFPPHRMVDVAEGFAGNGVVQSICQADLRPAFDTILKTIGRRLGAPCLPRPIPRGAQGTIGCDVVWELPTPARAPSGTPTSCTQAQHLLPTEGDQSPTADGGERCRVAQLAVQDGVVMPTEIDGSSFSDGWYYDDFSEETASGCVDGESKQRIAFTPAALPPPGVRVTIECTHQVPTGWTLPQSVDRNAEQPVLGDPCASVERHGQTLSGDEACAIRLATGQLDTSLFCDPRTHACAQSCESDDDCPSAWTCDDSASTRAATGDRASCVAACGLGSQGTSAKRVGAPCFPDFVPAGGYDPREAYLNTGNPDCGGGVCLVYHLEGDPVCSPETANEARSCATANEIENRVYCSCRCDAPDGAQECDCPDGFSCAPALDSGPESLRGGYCAKSSTTETR